jgi:hypothetical protein
MRINEILTENIFTTDYHKVMQAVAELYKNHYDINVWENAEAHDEAAKVLLKVHPTDEELDFIISSAALPERFMDLDFPINDDLMFNGSAAGGNDVVENDLDNDLDESADNFGEYQQMIRKIEMIMHRLHDGGRSPEDIQGLDAAIADKLRVDYQNDPMFAGAFERAFGNFVDEVEGGDDLEEEPASRALCTSGKPDSALGASQLSSCKSQGYRSREGGKSHKVGHERVKVRGKKIKGKKYGGPLPDWS